MYITYYMLFCTGYVMLSLLTFVSFSDAVEIGDDGYEGCHGNNEIHYVEEASQV